jgi:hypothetical protein
LNGTGAIRSRAMGDAPDSGSSASRNPNRWQEDQLAFRQEFAKDPSGFDRTPVFFRWWTRRAMLLGGLEPACQTNRLIRARGTWRGARKPAPTLGL